MMTFKTSMKTSYLVATDTEQAVDKYILLDVLECGIGEHFCELCRILTSPYGEWKYKQRRFRNALQQNSGFWNFEASLFVKKVFNLIIKGGELRLTLTDWYF